jgi:hypothetical protein
VLDLTSAKNRRVLECGHRVSSVLLSRIFFFRVKPSDDNGPTVSVSLVPNSVQRNLHIGDCYRTFPYARRDVAIPWSPDPDIFVESEMT